MNTSLKESVRFIWVALVALPAFWFVFETMATIGSFTRRLCEAAKGFASWHRNVSAPES